LKLERTILRVWGGDEPVNTHYGPMCYVMVAFAPEEGDVERQMVEEDGDEFLASIGCQPKNVNLVRDTLQRLIEARVEAKFEQKDNGKWKLVDYPGKKDSQMRILEPGTGVPPGGLTTATGESPPPASGGPSGGHSPSEARLDAMLNRFNTALLKLEGLVDVLDVIVKVNTEPVSTEEIAKQLDATVEDSPEESEAPPATGW
jgi:hypothetical protein